METKNLRLLVLDDSPNEAERFAAIFRNAGYATRLHRIASADDANSVLDQSWDLVIATSMNDNYDSLALLQLIRSKHLDIPFLQLVEPALATNEQEVIGYLKKGVQGVLSLEAGDEFLLLIAQHELYNLIRRRSLVRVEKKLSESERRCNLLLDSSVDAIAYIHEGMHIYINQAYADMFAYEDKSEMEGLSIIDLVSADNPNDLKDMFKHRVESTLACRGIKADGSKFPIVITTYPASYDGEECMQVIIRQQQEEGVNHDLLEEKIREMSSLDSLTGLYNRAYLSTLLDNAMHHIKSTESKATLLYIHIDNFDALSVQIGITGSDSLLVSFANLLKEYFCHGESLARLSDDAFVVLIPNKKSHELIDRIKALQEKVTEVIFDVNDFSIQITISVGVADFDKNSTNPQEVMDRAHRSVESVTGANSIKVYDPAEELAKAASQGDLLATLQQTLQQESLKLLYQPIVSLRGKSYELYEARLRMLDTEGKELPLIKLLDVASSAGMAEQIDRWVIVNSLKEVASMRAAGHKPRVFVQIGADTLKNEQLLGWLEKMFVATKLPPECLIIEFSESDAATYLKQAQGLVNGLNEMSCHSVISDFGKDENSLLTLNHLNTPFVKVAPVLVQALRKPEGVEALTSLLNKLTESNRKTIVPYVETASVLSVLWQAGADYIQGYYLQRPMPNMSYDFSAGQ